MRALFSSFSLTKRGNQTVSAVPLTFAVFAQRSFVRAGDLEPEVAAAVEHQFSVRADQAGERMLYFNRGL